MPVRPVDRFLVFNPQHNLSLKVGVIPAAFSDHDGVRMELRLSSEAEILPTTPRAPRFSKAEWKNLMKGGEIAASTPEEWKQTKRDLAKEGLKSLRLANRAQRILDKKRVSTLLSMKAALSSARKLKGDSDRGSRWRKTWTLLRRTGVELPVGVGWLSNSEATKYLKDCEFLMESTERTRLEHSQRDRFNAFVKKRTREWGHPSSSDFFRLTNPMKSKFSKVSVLGEDKRPLGSKKESLSLARRQWEEIFKERNTSINSIRDWIQWGSSVPENTSNTLARPFSEDELYAAIKSLKNKTPGLDLLNASFYKALGSASRTSLLTLINSFWSGEAFDQSLGEALVKLIPKGKLIVQPNGLRPITLLNMDYKLIESMLLARITSALRPLAEEGLQKKRHINNFFKIDSSVTFGSYCHVTADCPLGPEDRGLRLPWKFVDYKGVCRFFFVKVK